MGRKVALSTGDKSVLIFLSHDHSHHSFTVTVTVLFFGVVMHGYRRDICLKCWCWLVVVVRLMLHLAPFNQIKEQEIVAVNV